MGKRRRVSGEQDLFAPRCEACGQQLVRTESGYMACPGGHGRLLPGGVYVTRDGYGGMGEAEEEEYVRFAHEPHCPAGRREGATCQCMGSATPEPPHAA